MKPWDYHPDLSKNRLTIIGQIIADARNNVFEQFDERGDDAWALGCRAFSWVRKGITREAVGGEYPWLSIMDPSKQFIFKIGQIPVRFFRGDPDEQFGKTLNTIGREGMQFALVFPGERRAFQLVWRFVVETDFTGDLVGIWFIGATPDGIAECKWQVPVLDAELSELDSLLAMRSDGYSAGSDEPELPAPKVTLPKVDIDDAAGS